MKILSLYPWQTSGTFRTSGKGYLSIATLDTDTGVARAQTDELKYYDTEEKRFTNPKGSAAFFPLSTFIERYEADFLIAYKSKYPGYGKEPITLHPPFSRGARIFRGEFDINRKELLGKNCRKPILYYDDTMIGEALNAGGEPLSEYTRTLFYGLSDHLHPKNDFENLCLSLCFTVALYDKKASALTSEDSEAELHEALQRQERREQEEREAAARDARKLAQTKHILGI